MTVEQSLDETDPVDELLQFAIKCNRDGHEAAILEALPPYLKRRPEDEYAWFLYGDTLRVVGRFTEAKDVLLKVHRTFGKRALVAVRLGLLYKDQGKRVSAERWFARATAWDDGPTLDYVWIFRGANLANAGEFEHALACHRHAVDLAGHNQDEAYLNTGLVLRAMQRYDEAKVAFEQSLEITPDYREARVALLSLEGIEDAIKLVRTIASE